jgi:hypothetical protein
MKEEKQAELVALGRWCTAVLANFSRVGTSPFVSGMQGIVAKAIEKKSVTQLRTIKRDLSEWIRGLSPAQRTAVLEDVDQAGGKEGEEGEGGEEGEEVVVRRAIERGWIESEDEYRTLSTWLEFTQEDDKRADDLLLVDALLTKFGTKL